MADQLASARQLAEALGETIDGSVAATLLAAATAAVQAAAGQRLVAVTDDEVSILGSTDAWLTLPQGPVTAVGSVALDGTDVAAGTASGTYRRVGVGLWRDLGWAACASAPSVVTVVYSHGWPAGAQELEFARAATLSIAKGAYRRASAAEASGDGGATARALRDAAEAELVASPSVRTALRRQYGRRAGVVRLG